MQRLTVQKYFLENLDTVGCISGIVFGILITSLYLISKTIYLLMLGLALTLASLVYILTKNRKKISNIPIKSSTKIIFEIIFFFLFSISLWVLYINDGRPPLYFVLIALCTGFLALSILSIKTKIDTVLQIVKIFMISFNLKYSLFISFVGTGIDYWVHLADNNNLVQYGFIELLSGKEQFFPLMHIQVAINQVVTNTPIKDATNLAIIIPLVISSICVFLIARKIFDVKIALIALLIVNITDYHTYWGSAPQTTSFGICLFYFLIFVILQAAASTRNGMPWNITLLTLMLVLILTHAVSSFIFLITLVGLFVGSYVYKIFFDYRATLLTPILIVLLYGVMLLQYWFIAIYNEISGKPFFNVIVSTLDYYLTEHAAFLSRPESVTEYIMILPPFIERAANTFGLVLLMFLAVVGCLYWLSDKNRNRFSFSMLACTVLLLFITFVFPLFGIRNIIPTRWFAFMYLFLSIMAACGVFFLLTRIPTHRLGTVIFALIIICLTFFMSTSTISNLDSPLWLKESTISTSYSHQELQGTETLIKYSDSVFSDSRYERSIIRDYYRFHTTPVPSQDLSNHEGEIFIWRNYLINRPIKLSKIELVQKVYYNGGISGYLI